MRAGSLVCDDLGQAVTCVTLSHDNLCTLAACLDGRLRLLDKASGALLAQYQGIDLPQWMEAQRIAILMIQQKALLVHEMLF